MGFGDLLLNFIVGDIVFNHIPGGIVVIILKDGQQQVIGIYGFLFHGTCFQVGKLQNPLCALQKGQTIGVCNRRRLIVPNILFNGHSKVI
ncbi:MAG: hypothetical protein DRJ13_10170 [Bacteroidetes bacterium]|nr:MAG: hypothetical protein DRJ13_10170 [Bacteroidota bacterium]